MPKKAIWPAIVQTNHPVLVSIVVKKGTAKMIVLKKRFSKESVAIVVSKDIPPPNARINPNALVSTVVRKVITRANVPTLQSHLRESAASVNRRATALSIVPTSLKRDSLVLTVGNLGTLDTLSNFVL